MITVLLLSYIVAVPPTAEREKATSVVKINFMLIWYGDSRALQVKLISRPEALGYVVE